MVVLLALVACKGPGDSDTDVDTDVAAAGLDGVLTYVSTVDGVTRCDQEIAVHGEPSERDCPDCTWVFDVTGTVVRDRSVADCRASPVVTFVEGYGYYDLAIAAAPAFTVDWVEPPVELTQVLLSGYSHDGGDYLLEGVWEPLSWDGDESGSWSDADGLAWTRSGSWEEVETALDGWSTCPDFVWSPPAAHPVGPEVEEDLPCDVSSLDTWTFTGTAGTVVGIGADTVAADSAFTPFLFLNGPEDCTIVNGIDNVDCAFESANGPARSCPAIEVELPDDGRYELWVGSDLGCTGTVGRYALTTSGIDDLVLVDDDQVSIVETVHPWTESISFAATITGER